MQNASNFYRVYIKDTNLLVYNLLARRKSVLKYMHKERLKLDEKYYDESGLKDLPAERLEYQNELKD